MSINSFRKTRYFEFGAQAAAQVERLIQAVSGNPPIGETSVAQKLDAIIAMQQQFEVRLGLLESRTEIIHGLVSDLVTSLTTDPEKINELAARVKAVREKLKSSVDSQTKGE